MEVTASVDTGSNTTALIEKLAAQIGVTADTLFPWYVQQQVIEGWMFFILTGTIAAFGVLLVVRYWGEADFAGSGNSSTWPCLYGFVLLAASVTACLSHGVAAASQILNPNYHAVQAIINDMAKLFSK